MNVSQSFKRLAFGQILLGIVTFCLVEPNPALLLIAGSIGLLAWYVTQGPSGRTLPRWAVNVGALLAVGWLVLDLRLDPTRMVIAMGHFVMALQVLMLYMSKSNREYAQLLVLSLLQMVGASVLPGGVNVIFGVLLVAYCMLGMLTVLSFHFKTCGDAVREGQVAGAPEGLRVRRQAPVLGRGFGWQVRVCAVVIGGLCGLVAVVVFVVLPRGGGGQLSGELNRPGGASEVGFSDRVQLSGMGLKSGSAEAVLNLVVRSGDGTPIGSGTMPWLLRGAALDHYDASARTWVRSSSVSLLDTTLELEGQTVWFTHQAATSPVLEADITLRQAGYGHLFTVTPPVGVVAAPMRLTSANLAQVRFGTEDFQLSTLKRPSGAAIYSLRWPIQPVGGEGGPFGALRAARVASLDTAAAGQFPPQEIEERRGRPGNVPRGDGVKPERGLAWGMSDGLTSGSETLEESRGLLLSWTVQRPRVKALAESVLKDRLGEGFEDASASAKASALADYLRENYAYSVEALGRDTDDPVVRFLFTRQRGHCELFASGLAAMCRTVGVGARVVTGYRASEFNTVGEYYVVRQSNAHAWTEVLTETGLWKTVDATPGDLVAAEHASRDGWWTPLRQLYEHAEYAWIRSVLSYDNQTRRAVLGGVNDRVVKAADMRQYGLPGWGELYALASRYWRFDQVALVMAGFVLVLIGVAVASLARLLWLRRRKVTALQLSSLPRKQRKGLTRRLRFYLQMLELLERHGMARPVWQSPYGFARELAEANPMRYDPVVALTEQFYAVRFGHRRLDPDRQKLVRAHLRQLEANLVRRGEER